MATESPVSRSIQQAAVDRLRRFVEKHDDQSVFTLVEIAEATAMDPNTVASAMELLDEHVMGTTRLEVTREARDYGELQWRIRRVPVPVTRD